jgi:hypothetical protein
MSNIEPKKEFKIAAPKLAESLSDEDIDQLLSITQRLEIPPGRKIIRDQQPVEQIFIVLSGKLNAVVEDEAGQSLVIGSIGPGELIGEVSLLSGAMIASSSVVTSTDVAVLRMPHLAFSSLMNDGSRLSITLLEYIVSRLGDRLKAARQRIKSIDKSAIKFKDDQSRSFLGRLLGLR